MKKLVLASAFSLVLGLSVLAACSTSGASTETDGTNEPVDSAGESFESAASETEEAEVLEPASQDIYCAGTYLVGVDIPAGSYLVTTEDYVLNEDRESYVTVCPDKSCEGYVYDEGFVGDRHVNVADGQALVVRGATFAPQGNALDSDGSYCAGTYLVGTDIPAGVYELTTEEAEENKSYVTVYADNSYEDFVYDDGFVGSQHVSVENGQILAVQGATFVLA